MAEQKADFADTLEDYLIDEEMPILDALARIDHGAQRVLFVVKDGKLLASLTDGDVRRHILRQGDLKAAVREAANYHHKALPVSERSRALSFMKEKSLEGVPLLGEDGRIADVVTWKALTGHQRRQKKSVLRW